MQLPWHGYYINLDRSVDRRRTIEADMARVGLAGAYRRFSALGGEPRPASCRLNVGEYGCFRSHHVLLAAAPRDGRFVHVVEDDTVFSRPFAGLIASAVAGGALGAFDLVFTDTLVKDDLPLIRMLKSLFDQNTAKDRPLSLSLLDLKDTDFATTSSYLVGPRSLDRVTACLAAGLAAGPRTPVDLFMRSEVRAGRLKAGLLFPFLTGVNAVHQSTIAPTSASVLVAAILRNSFFVERDLEDARRQMAGVIAAVGLAGAEPHLDLLTGILRFYASDRYRPF